MASENQLQRTEDVILEYPYKSFGILKVTRTQLIFQKAFFGFNTFSGVINISDLEEVKYLKRVSAFSVPSLKIVYRLPSKKTKTVNINFPSSSGRLGIELKTGMTPEKVFETIVTLKNNSK